MQYNRYTLTLEEEEDVTEKFKQWNALFTFVIALVVIVGTVSIATSLLMALYNNDWWRTQLKFKRGAVATDSLECSRVGASILQAGGNAVDAAIASALCLGVLRPFARYAKQTNKHMVLNYLYRLLLIFCLFLTQWYWWWWFYAYSHAQ